MTQLKSQLREENISQDFNSEDKERISENLKNIQQEQQRMESSQGSWHSNFTSSLKRVFNAVDSEDLPTFLVLLYLFFALILLIFFVLCIVSGETLAG